LVKTLIASGNSIPKVLMCGAIHFVLDAYREIV
jgi:hypothetical protein